MNSKEKDELREAIGKEFPYTWLDPLLIGKDVPELPWNCLEIEWYTRQLKERILKAIEAFEANEEEQCPGCMGPCGQCEHPQPSARTSHSDGLDAGEYYKEHGDFGNWMKFAESFAQASITAKQKEWEETEKGLLESREFWIIEYNKLKGKEAEYNFWIKELLKALDSGDNRPVEAAVRELQELTEKHTNNIKTNE